MVSSAMRPAGVIPQGWRVVTSDPPLGQNRVSSVLLTPILSANEPIDGTERQDRRCEREHLLGLRLGKIDDHQLADDGEQRDQEHGANLDDAMTAVCNDKQRALEFERDDDREDHTEKRLEHLVICRIKPTGNDAEKDFQRSEERRVGKECRSRWSPY